MAYSNDDDFAQDHNYANWIAYTALNPDPSQTKLGRLRAKATRTINNRIKCFDTDITDTTYTGYLKELELEVIERIRDKQIHRKSGERNIYMPHDYLYQDERDALHQIGIIKGYIKVGMVG